MKFFADFLSGFPDFQPSFLGVQDFEIGFRIFSDFQIFNLMILMDFFIFLWVFQDMELNCKEIFKYFGTYE